MITEYNDAGGATMARKVEVRLLDDIDGGPADETLSFGLDGVNYEIDLSAKNAGTLRTALEKYVGASRKVGRGQVVPSRGRRSGGEPARGDRAQNKAIRE
ncbi:MAG TPA: Lsr2 family protein, partial [Ktedonobacterales bacterium]|nr:Lsr2 family protein [Ktedonobacterales bacterium]